MKFVKASLVVLLIIVSVLLLLGVFVPEVDDQFETRIDRPLIQVYASVMNLSRAPEWVVGLDSVAQTSGFLAMPGSTFRLYYSGTETKEIYDLEVVEMVPLQSVRFSMQNDMFLFDVSIRFESDGLATVLHTYCQIKGKSLMTRSFLPLLKSSIMEVGKENFEALKKLEEE
ncbi:MAG: hypothetical protein RL266_2816 [Bacteroidota bacterium]|jgi:hypothetical protein